LEAIGFDWDLYFKNDVAEAKPAIAVEATAFGANSDREGDGTVRIYPLPSEVDAAR
jgi:hypothetical protein